MLRSAGFIIAIATLPLACASEKASVIVNACKLGSSVPCDCADGVGARYCLNGASYGDCVCGGRVADAAIEGDGCVPKEYFVDLDGDHWAGMKPVLSCVPLPEAWKALDCDDNHPLIFPNQKAYFALPTPRSPFDFDYNCNELNEFNPEQIARVSQPGPYVCGQAYRFGGVTEVMTCH